ncbi:cytochrome P450 [Mycena maculata]|uniref:Cytochrome P450 n=1 Tax=Mycena maculata TaxID=230809 RepID=A0AAD7NVB6_9AGAR|nr:cytochrome P450 [Mycena maculata]
MRTSPYPPKSTWPPCHLWLISPQIYNKMTSGAVQPTPRTLMSSIVPSQGFIWASIATTVVGLAWFRTRNRSKLPLPPGPKKLPLVGNLFDMTIRPWEACMQWSKTYNSDIIHLNLAGQSVIVLSSFEATEALLEQRSSIYSDRPEFPMVGDLMGWKYALLFMKYGEEWRTHRRLFNQEFNTQSSLNFRPAERAASHGLLRRLLRDPDDFLGHLRQMTGEVILSVAYGIDVLPVDDPYLALAEKGVKSLSDASVTGRFLVDSIPILKYIPEWVPGAEFKRIAREGKALSQTFRDRPFAEAKRRMASGEAPSSFTVNALRDLESGDQYYQESTVKNVAASMYAGGADTTVSSLSTFLLAMLANPDAQKKAQAEIDSVVERGNLPDFIDESQMPYVAAIVKEVLRWKNVGPLGGVPHFLQTEDEYRGYRLPAGSLVIGNVWAILHDEIMYPDPYAFKPERFLLDGKPNPAVRDPQPAFGFGRRICPGRQMAMSSLWISIVSILSVFDITKQVGKDGRCIEPTYEYTDGILCAPVPFKCSIKPRSKDAISLVQATSNEV